MNNHLIQADSQNSAFFYSSSSYLAWVRNGELFREMFFPEAIVLLEVLRKTLLVLTSDSQLSLYTIKEHSLEPTQLIKVQKFTHTQLLSASFTDHRLLACVVLCSQQSADGVCVIKIREKSAGQQYEEYAEFLPGLHGLRLKSLAAGQQGLQQRRKDKLFFALFGKQNFSLVVSFYLTDQERLIAGPWLISMEQTLNSVALAQGLHIAGENQYFYCKVGQPPRLVKRFDDEVRICRRVKDEVLLLSTNVMVAKKGELKQVYRPTGRLRDIVLWGRGLLGLDQFGNLIREVGQQRDVLAPNQQYRISNIRAVRSEFYPQLRVERTYPSGSKSFQSLIYAARFSPLRRMTTSDPEFVLLLKYSSQLILQDGLVCFTSEELDCTCLLTFLWKDRELLVQTVPLNEELSNEFSLFAGNVMLGGKSLTFAQVTRSSLRLLGSTLLECELQGLIGRPADPDLAHMSGENLFLVIHDQLHHFKLKIDRGIAKDFHHIECLGSEIVQLLPLNNYYTFLIRCARADQLQIRAFSPISPESRVLARIALPRVQVLARLPLQLSAVQVALTVLLDQHQQRLICIFTDDQLVPNRNTFPVKTAPLLLRTDSTLLAQQLVIVMPASQTHFCLASSKGLLRFPKSALCSPADYQVIFQPVIGLPTASRGSFFTSSGTMICLVDSSGLTLGDLNQQPRCQSSFFNQFEVLGAKVQFSFRQKELSVRIQCGAFVSDSRQQPFMYEIIFRGNTASFEDHVIDVQNAGINRALVLLQHSLLLCKFALTDGKLAAQVLRVFQQDDQHFLQMKNQLPAEEWEVLGSGVRQYVKLRQMLAKQSGKGQLEVLLLGEEKLIKLTLLREVFRVDWQVSAGFTRLLSWDKQLMAVDQAGWVCRVTLSPFQSERTDTSGNGLLQHIELPFFGQFSRKVRLRGEQERPCKVLSVSSIGQVLLGGSRLLTL